MLAPIIDSQMAAYADVQRLRNRGTERESSHLRELARAFGRPYE